MPESLSKTHNPPWWLSGLAGSLGMVIELTLGGQVLTRVVTAQQADPNLKIVDAFKAIHYQKGMRGFFAGYRWNVGMACCKGFTRWSLNNAAFTFCHNHIPQEVQKKYPSLIPATVGLGGAAFETTLYLCPLESLKTREMTQLPSDTKKIAEIIRQEGPSLFFRGWTGLFPRQAVAWSTYLLVYDKYRSALLKLREGERVNKGDKFVVNALTGATAALLTTPLDLYKTQRQKERPIGNIHIFRSLKELFADYGWKGLYRSLPMRISRSAFYAAATFTVMDYFNALPARMKL